MTPEELREQTQQLIQSSVDLVTESTEYAQRACIAWGSGNFPEYYQDIGQQVKQRVDDEYEASKQRSE